MESATNQSRLTRRSFLKKAGAITSVAAISPFTISSFLARSSDDRRIIVIGGGLAGLSCAYELDQANTQFIPLIEVRFPFSVIVAVTPLLSKTRRCSGRL